MHPPHRRAWTREPDLFGPQGPPDVQGGPGWRSLPEATREAVTALMIRLLGEHAARLAREPEGAADER